MANINIGALSTANVRRWNSASVTKNFIGISKSLVNSKARYQAVAAKTGVPWFIIAVIHERESSQNWGRSLAQGDPWDRKSIHVPAGRGPFNSWEEAAIDALLNCAPYLAKKHDWTLGMALVNMELYNGVGYALRNVPSPYLWAGTDQYKAGKFVADGKYDPTHVDTQPGCAALLKLMIQLDPSIQFTPPAFVARIPAPVAAPAPSMLSSAAQKIRGLFVKS